VISPDGIIGSESYLEIYLKTAREFDYLRERRAAYLVLYLPLRPSSRESREPPEIAVGRSSHVASQEREVRKRPPRGSSPTRRRLY
jgi:hypothetical protein